MSTQVSDGQSPTGPPVVTAPGRPAWWSLLGRGPAADGELAELRRGAPVRTTGGQRLGHLDLLGLGLGAQHLTLLGTERWLYPARALVAVTARGEVVVDATLRAQVFADREIGRRTPAWSADDVELRIAGLQVSLRDGRIGHVLVRRRRFDPVRLVRWELARVERDGVALAIQWRTPAPSEGGPGPAAVADLPATLTWVRPARRPLRSVAMWARRLWRRGGDGVV